MLYSIVKFFNALSELKKQMNERRLFGEFIYAACFVMMLFFLVGYVLYLVLFFVEEELAPNAILISLIFFFGAIFVNAMITMIRRMFTVITEKEKLSRDKEIAEEGSRMKGEFLSRMSHEIRTPMNAIIGMTTIGKSAQETDRKDYCLGAIEDASKHLLGIINDVLDMSKIEANKLELSYSIFNLRDMTNLISTLVTPQTKAKNQQLIISINENVPSIIKSDEQRLRQVITNLLGNAVKFSPENSAISLTIETLSQEEDRATIRFEVKDMGIGMSEEQIERLFTPFEQADNSISRKYGGTGLGLAISQQIIEMMGSSIQVTSELGNGSCFLFEISVELPAAEDLPLSMRADEDVTTDQEDFDFSGKKVLIAEDIEINREIVATLLEPSNISIDFAEDGRVAYDLFAKNLRNYDIIFMDLHMPEVNGLESTSMIRKLDDSWAKDVPIIAMTADVFNEDIEKCLEAGMNGHVGKPIDMHSVLAVLNKHLS